MQKKNLTRPLQLGVGVVAGSALVAMPSVAYADTYNDVVNSADPGSVYVGDGVSGFSNIDQISLAIAGENIAVMKVSYDPQSETLSLQDAANEIVSQGVDHVIIVGVTPANQTQVFMSPSDTALLGKVFTQGVNVDTGVLQLVTELTTTTTESVIVPTENIPDGSGAIFGSVGAGVGLIALFAAAVVVIRSRRKSKARKLSQIKLPAVMGKDKDALIQNIRALTQQLQQSGDRVPQQITTKVFKILETVKDTITEWDKTPETKGTQYTLDSVVSEYLPNAINNYLCLPNSYLSRNKQKTEANLNEQLDLLQDAMDHVQDAVFNGVEDEIVTQTKFLQDKFGHTQQKGMLQI